MWIFVTFITKNQTKYEVVCVYYLWAKMVVCVLSSAVIRSPVDSPHKGPVTRKCFHWWRHHMLQMHRHQRGAIQSATTILTQVSQSIMNDSRTLLTNVFSFLSFATFPSWIITSFKNKYRDSSMSVLMCGYIYNVRGKKTKGSIFVDWAGILI